MRVRGGIALGGAVLLLALLAPAVQADTPWRIGAAKVDTTPPAFNGTQDLQDFPEVDTARGMICPRATYNGPRLWRFEEPYTDTDGSGDFNYPDQAGVPTPEPYCDYNHNGRWEGIYSSGGVDHLAKTLHDPIDARAVAFSNGPTTIVLESVVAQGIFENYIREARTMAQSLAGQAPHQTTCGHIDEMVISSNHNESSPDTVGIYGAPPDPVLGAFGLNSSIDEYYMDWLDEQMANAAVEACDNREPASLRAVEFPVPPDLEQEIPSRFPTADDFGNHAAIDDKVRVLQGRDATGDPIFTMMNLADHNQDIGHSDSFEESHAISSDWPGSFHRHLEQDVGGMAMFLAGDNGSQEDLITDPRILDPPCDNGHNGCFAQVEHTGDVIAGHVAGELADAKPVSGGPVSGDRAEFCAPLENNLFLAAFEAGLFGERQAYTNCVPTGKVGNQVHTSVALLTVGDVQFIVNPGEAFPQLMLGGPWGIEDASCPNRPNPGVPTWHARATYKFQVGLGDDLIGYEKPAWSFLYDTPGTFIPTDGCTSDPHNHSHALEDEAVGPTIANMVADNLSTLIDQADPDLSADIRLGRYVKADGSLTDPYTAPQDQGAPGHWPTDAVAIWLADPGSTNLNGNPASPDNGTIVALGSVARFGGNRPVDYNGRFMDFDGAEQPGAPNLNTRGMVVKDSAGTVLTRFYVDVYPALTVTGQLGPAIPPEYARPGSATPLRVPLVPEYRQCTTPNDTHAAPLSLPACRPPVQQSSLLTMSSLGKGSAFARFSVVPGDTGTPENDEDVEITASATDVRNAGGATDYTGQLLLRTAMRITDGANQDGPATVEDSRFDVPMDCAATPNPNLGSACSVTTTANTLVPGFSQEGRLAIISALSLTVQDAGLDGDVTGPACPPACGTGDEAAFLREGVVTP